MRADRQRKFGAATRHIYVFGDDGDEFAATARPKAEAGRLPAWARTAPPPERERPRLIRPSRRNRGRRSRRPVSPAGAKARRAVPARPAGAHPAGPPAGDRSRRSERGIALAFLTAQGQAPEEAAALVESTLPCSTTRIRARVRARLESRDRYCRRPAGAGRWRPVSGRIDRLAVSGDEVLAIDFKTNRPPPTRLEDVSAVYVRQMALYRLALAKLFPGEQIACALVWTEGPASDAAARRACWTGKSPASRPSP